MLSFLSSIFRQIKSNPKVMFLLIIILIALGFTLFNSLRLLAIGSQTPGEREYYLIAQLKERMVQVPRSVESLSSQENNSKEELTSEKNQITALWEELQGFEYIDADLINRTNESMNSLMSYIDAQIDSNANIPLHLRQSVSEEVALSIAIAPFVQIEEIEAEVALKAQEALYSPTIRAIIISIGVIVAALFAVIASLWLDAARILKQLEAAHEESRGILSTVQEGLFLIHEDKNIGSEYSDELTSILGTDEISGNSLTGLLTKIVSDQHIQNVNSFINSIFNPKVVEELITSLNPLKEIAVSIAKPDGTFEEKYLSFNFYRVSSGGKIRDILASVKDVTDSVLLKEQIEANKNENEQQLQLLVSLMNINRTTLKLFLEESITSMKNINAVLKAEVKNPKDFYQKIDNIFIHIHKIKGEASAIELDNFAEQAHNFETELQEMKKIKNMGGMDFLPLTVKLNQMITYSETLTDASNLLTNNMVETKNSDNTPAPQQAARADEWSHLDKLVRDLSTQYGKEVSFVSSGLSEVALSDDHKKSLNGTLVHLIKNSLVHGIETPEERKSLKKPKKGRIDLRLSTLDDNSIEVILRDDGRGFDYSKIAQTLVEKSYVDENTISSWGNDDLIKFIFKHDLSTAEVDINAGRGVGLSVILESIRKLGGKLHVSQTMNKYCQFAITLPSA